MTPDRRGSPRANLRVVRPGLLSTIQDTGRPGLAHMAVPRSGAADPASLRLANRLVGNPETAAGIETTLLGADLRLTAGRWVAVVGAPCLVRVAGTPAATDCPVYVPAGALLSIGPADRGVRSYLAVAGGLSTPVVLGSRATDMLSGLGPARLSAGDLVPLGRPVRPPAAVDVAPRAPIPDQAALRLVPGPRDAWFSATVWHTLVSTAYEVSPASDRIGVRLIGAELRGLVHVDLPSEGLVRGAVQVPPGGQPLIFLADHPTTGGYPVIGVVHPGDMWLVAQARPGSTVRFAATHRRGPAEGVHPTPPPASLSRAGRGPGTGGAARRVVSCWARPH